MSEQLSSLFLKALLEKHYGVKVWDEPARLPGEGGQQVYKVGLTSGESWTVRLGLASRPKEKLLAETSVLGFVNRANFPAPRLQITLTGETVFEWQPGRWGYALEFVEGNHPPRPESPAPGPMLDRVSLVELGRLLGQLHNLDLTADHSLHQPPAQPTAQPTDQPTDQSADWSGAEPPANLDWPSDWLAEVPAAIEWAEQAAHNPEWTEKAGEVGATLRNLPLAELKALPRVLIHTDAHEGNLIWTPEGALVLLDWENAGLDLAVLDLALVLSWLCSWEQARDPTGLLVERYDFDQEYCRAFLASYQRERILTGPEREMLGPAIRFLDGWFAARDIKREIAAPGSSGGMARLNWAFMRSLTPEWAATLTGWAGETAPPGVKR
jgi:Ser/Thr protein kinase RdoA (MazF antagonist)